MLIPRNRQEIPLKTEEQLKNAKKHEQIEKVSASSYKNEKCSQFAKKRRDIPLFIKKVPYVTP